MQDVLEDSREEEVTGGRSRLRVGRGGRWFKWRREKALLLLFFPHTYVVQTTKDQ